MWVFYVSTEWTGGGDHQDHVLCLYLRTIPTIKQKTHWYALLLETVDLCSVRPWRLWGNDIL